MNGLRKPGFLYLALLGALVATLCDANHVYTGTLSYPAPFFAGQAWWVFPGFTVVFFGMAVSYVLLAYLLGRFMPVRRSQSPGSLPAMAETLILFAFVYLASGFGNESPRLLSLIFYGTFVLRWLVTYERGWALIQAVLLCFGGMFGEGLMSKFGLVAYRHVDVFYVPYWLGALYMHGALALRESVRFFVYRRPA